VVSNIDQEIRTRAVVVTFNVVQRTEDKVGMKKDKGLIKILSTFPYGTACKTTFLFKIYMAMRPRLVKNRPENNDNVGLEKCLSKLY